MLKEVFLTCGAITPKFFVFKKTLTSGIYNKINTASINKLKTN